VRRALALGIALAPEDRKTQGLVLELPAETNVAMSDLTRVARGGWISQARLRTAARDAVIPFGFNPDRVSETPARLSGGNQQKLLLARWKYAEPRILLADEPPRGIDIGAKQDVLGALRDMAQRGLAVILVSSELEELVASCDRVDVLSEGHLAGRLDRAKDDLTVSAILEKAFSS
jgi:ABC-type sugar transport system ATPase subunit